MKVFGIVLGVALFAFLIYQVFGVINDIKKKRQQKKNSVEEKEKTE